MTRRVELRKGATRSVFLLKKVVVKVPRVCSWRNFLNGLLSNLQERTFWRELRHPRLARVIFADPVGLMVVMERADETFSDDSISKQDRLAIAYFLERCERDHLPVDWHCSNVGRFGKNLKLIDYGD